MILDKKNLPDFGFMLIDKPANRSSHYAVYYLRKLTGIQKVGHAGTLDPFASGLLLMAVGRPATKKIGQFVKLDKEYEAEVFLGKIMDTYDRTGKIIDEYDGQKIPRTVMVRALKKFVGQQTQRPPMFSAKKIAGKKLYLLARKDIEVEREARSIEIFSLKILSYKWPSLSLRVKCSSGTYIRTIAYYLGQALGCGAYLRELRRTKIGRFSIDEAQELDKIDKDNWKKYLRDLS